MKEQMRNVLINAYRDYLNNYISVARYAECNALTEEQAQDFIRMARQVTNSEHPEA
jgi:hypothetical protein